MRSESERARVDALQSTSKALDSDTELAAARAAKDAAEALLAAQVEPQESLKRALINLIIEPERTPLRRSSLRRYS